jgi:hypothetical protein
MVRFDLTPCPLPEPGRGSAPPSLPAPRVSQEVKEKAAFARQLRRSMTVAEQILWERLRSNRLQKMHFRRQQVIRGFIVDFYCHASRLVIEVDGPVLIRKLIRIGTDQILEQYGSILSASQIMKSKQI